MLKKSILINLFIACLCLSSCAFLSQAFMLGIASEIDEMTEEQIEVLEAPDIVEYIEDEDEEIAEEYAIEVEPEPMEEYAVEDAPPPPPILLEENEKRNYNKSPQETIPIVTADKMNVFYIGVENPLTVNVPGVSPDKYKVSAMMANIKRGGKAGNYSVTCTRPGEVKIMVSGEGIPQSVNLFRAKRIPNPVAKLNRNSGGAMGNGEFKAQGGVIAVLENFDFDAKCQIQGFMLERITKDNERSEVINRGARYSAESKSLVNQSKPGDLYLYTNVKVKCPGDAAGRKINNMVFKIK